MTSLQRPTTCPTYWRHATVCYTRYGSCAVTASLSLRYMMSFVLPSSRSWPTAHLRGPVRALLPTALSYIGSRCKRLEYCSSEVPTYSDLTDETEDIFIRIMANQGHVLQPLLPDRHSIPYSLRERSHKTLLNKTTHLNNDDFLIRISTRTSYMC